MPDEREIRKVLDSIVDPCSAGHGVPMGLDEMGLIEMVDIADGHVTVHMRLTSPCCLMVGYFATEAASRISALPGVHSVNLEHDTGFAWRPAMIHPDAEYRRRLALVGVRPS
jgi:metal-sulfur cluster biosynthetic enzyme